MKHTKQMKPKNRVRLASKPRPKPKRPKRPPPKRRPKVLESPGRVVVTGRLPRVIPRRLLGQTHIQTAAALIDIKSTDGNPNPATVTELTTNLFPMLGGLTLYKRRRLLRISMAWLPATGMSVPGSIAFHFDPESVAGATARPFSRILLSDSRFAKVVPIYEKHDIVNWSADANYRLPVDVDTAGTKFALAVVPAIHAAMDGYVKQQSGAEEIVGRIMVHVDVEYSDPVAPVTTITAGPGVAVPSPAPFEGGIYPGGLVSKPVESPVGH